MNHPVHILACGALVRDDMGRVLLVKNPRRGWEFPGGHVEVGESLTEAVLREVREESGVAVRVGRLIAVSSNVGTYHDCDGDIEPSKTMFDFACSYVSGELRASEESAEVGWFSAEDAVNMVELHPFKLRLKSMLAGVPGVVYRAWVTQPHFEVREDTVV